MARRSNLGRYGLIFGLAVAMLLAASSSHAAATPISIVVKILPGSNLPLIGNLLGGSVIDAIPEANTYLLNLPSLPLLTPTLKLLGVEWVERDRVVSLPAGSLRLLDVPSVPGDWYKQQPALQLIHTQAAQNYSTGHGLLIADINSRVDFGHPALAGHLGAGYDFVANRPSTVAALNDDQSTAGFLDDDQSTAGFLDDDQSTAGFLDGNGIHVLSVVSSVIDPASGASAHGTFCAGLLVAVAPDATVMPLRAFDDNGTTDLFTLAKAIRYARKNGAQVINMSFGTLTDAKVVHDAIDYARAGNVVLVASAGNNNSSAPQYPAAYSGVVSVAATDLLDRKASFSNFGSSVFVDAPGTHIISAIPGGRFGIASGTSFSAPMVTGMAALIRSHQFGDTRTIISQSAVRIDTRNPQYSGQLGYGRIDLLPAVSSH